MKHNRKIIIMSDTQTRKEINTSITKAGIAGVLAIFIGIMMIVLTYQKPATIFTILSGIIMYSGVMLIILAWLTAYLVEKDLYDKLVRDNT